ncbi:MAG: hypothetical protein M0D57_01280 [Sphingobacteriales bacterium JAD_PAG50586_3]|nr:MAG: hypothetical protein M0D57_01280 [Sphingobacteriales bacterium JAD_PAG50586_3]
MQAENTDKERVSKAINGLSTGIVFLLLVIFGLIIYILYFSKPSVEDKAQIIDSAKANNTVVIDTLADTTSTK